MASGDVLAIFTPLGYEPTSANYATLGFRNQHPTLLFDASTVEYACWTSILPSSYASGGLTVEVHYSMVSATANAVVINVEIERIGSEVQDTDSDGFASARSVTSTVSTTSGNVKSPSVTFTSGAQMDSLAANELFRIRVSRDATNGSDTATGDMELHAVYVKET